MRTSSRRRRTIRCAVRVGDDLCTESMRRRSTERVPPMAGGPLMHSIAAKPSRCGGRHGRVPPYAHQVVANARALAVTLTDEGLRSSLAARTPPHAGGPPAGGSRARRPRRRLDEVSITVNRTRPVRSENLSWRPAFASARRDNQCGMKRTRPRRRRLIARALKDDSPTRRPHQARGGRAHRAVPSLPGRRVTFPSARA